MKYLFILSIFFNSCASFGDCDSNAKALKEDECLLIVRKIPSVTDDIFNYRGTNILQFVTHKIPGACATEAV